MYIQIWKYVVLSARFTSC